jgi:hypothetical protein
MCQIFLGTLEDDIKSDIFIDILSNISVAIKSDIKNDVNSDVRFDVNNDVFEKALLDCRMGSNRHTIKMGTDST